MTEEEIIKQLEANTVALKEMQAITLKTARYLKWLRVMEIIKWVLVLVPLIAAYIYLPSLLQSLAGSYGDLMPAGLNSLLK